MAPATAGRRGRVPFRPGSEATPAVVRIARSLPGHPAPPVCMPPDGLCPSAPIQRFLSVISGSTAAPGPVRPTEARAHPSGGAGRGKRTDERNIWGERDRGGGCRGRGWGGRWAAVEDCAALRSLRLIHAGRAPGVCPRPAHVTWARAPPGQRRAVGGPPCQPLAGEACPGSSPPRTVMRARTRWATPWLQPVRARLGDRGHEGGPLVPPQYAHRRTLASAAHPCCEPADRIALRRGAGMVRLPPRRPAD